MKPVVTPFSFVRVLIESDFARMLGTPNDDNWPGVSKLKGYVTPSEVIPLRPHSLWLAYFRAIGETGVDLLVKMLTLDPRKRLNAGQVLRHEFWTSDPRPSRLEDLPRKGGGIETMGEDLKRRGGEVPNGVGSGGGRVDKVARKIDFGSAR